MEKAVILLLFSAVSGIILIRYGVWRKIHHIYSRQEYADITELDSATLNRLIKEIVVHEHIDSEKTRHISIEIHFNLKPIPEVEQVTA